MTTRFTIDGSDELENALLSYCNAARDGILKIIPERHLKAIVLGGGYGRGEGGVLQSIEGHKPYNDMEFYIITTGSDLLLSRRYQQQIQHLAHVLSEKAGLEIEFKLLSLRKLERSPVSMFYYDLIAGHRLVYGSDRWIENSEHHRAAHRIPLHEATRLLFNRCTGLLLSQEKLNRSSFSSGDADFVGRNLAKAKLALGDVLLTMRQQYHWSCQERHKRLRKLNADDALRTFSSVEALHAEGVAFKLRPVQRTGEAEAFREELESLKAISARLWLALESTRLGLTFTDIRTYAFDAASKCPETHPLKNRLINARRFGPTAILDSSYPRDRLLRAMPLLLWTADSLKDKDALAFIHKQLRTTATSYPDLVSAYHSLWRLYN